MTEPRRLRGHSAAATCCIASKVRPGLIATAVEDGLVCWYDLRCKDMLYSMDVGSGNPVSSICFKPGNEEIIYISVENEVKCFDLHVPTLWKHLESYKYNKDEINQIACHAKSSFLAAADDAGDVKIVDVHQRCLYKTLRSGHQSICSSVQFLPWRSWEVITGGLDSRLAVWDFSRGRPNKIMDFGIVALCFCFYVLHYYSYAAYYEPPTHLTRKEHYAIRGYFSLLQTSRTMDNILKKGKLSHEITLSAVLELRDVL